MQKPRWVRAREWFETRERAEAAYVVVTSVLVVMGALCALLAAHGRFTGIMEPSLAVFAVGSVLWALERIASGAKRRWEERLPW